MTNESHWQDEREVRIDATPEQVWAAWAEPTHVANWFSDEAHGTLSPGSELVHVFHGHGEHRYRVVSVDAPRSLVLEGEMDGLAFRQEVRIERSGGSTVLRLVHSGFGVVDPDSEITQGIDSGWTMALALLKQYVERYFGQAKASVSLFRSEAFEYARLLEHFYTSAHGLGQWLTDGQEPIHAAGRVRLQLRPAARLSGNVLTKTAHEVSVSWEEIDGALELKAFGAGPQARTLGLRVTSWAADADVRLAALRPDLDAALTRLCAALRA
ncbi:MAG: SRPBCC domain-containing protein [Gemmatimonadota bacterium]